MQAQLHTRFTQHDKNIHVFITFADLFSGQMILNAELHKQFCFSLAWILTILKVKFIVTHENLINGSMQPSFNNI